MKRQLLSVLAGVALVSCGGSSSGGSDSDSGSGGGGSSATVNFFSSNTILEEQDDIIVLILTLSSTVAQDVAVNFTFTGNAQNNGDFNVLTTSPVIFPNQQTTASILIQVREDTKGEIDEYVNFELVNVSGAKLGPNTTHRLDILDNDGSPYDESEPNDMQSEADLVDVDFSRTESYQITGNVNVAGTDDPADYFNLVATAEEGFTIDFNLDPAASLALGQLTLLDAAEQVLETFVSQGPGAPLGGTYAVEAGQAIYMKVETFDSSTNYFLDVVGLEFGLLDEGDDGDRLPSGH